MLEGRVTLFKTMFGSKLYGTNTPQSDEDWKEVFLPPIDLLLVGKKPTNIVYSTGKDHERNTKDDIDYEYIPVQVFANDVLGGQTYAIELAFAVLNKETHAGQELKEQWFYNFTLELVTWFLTSNVKAMIGYAMNQANIYGIKGTRLATVKKFAEKLDSMVAAGEVTLEDRLEKMMPWAEANKDKYMYPSTYENHDVVFPAISLLEKQYPTNISFEDAIGRTRKLQSKYGSRAESAENAKGVDWKATAHAIRITQQAIELLEHRTLHFPFTQDRVEHLLNIKHGNIPFDDVAMELADLFDKLDAVKDKTSLQEASPALNDKFEAWLKRWMTRVYKINQTVS